MLLLGAICLIGRVPAISQSISFPIQSHDFGQAEVSGTPATTASINLTVAGTATPIFSLAFGREYSLGQSICSGSPNLQCSINVTFNPLTPGVREDGLLVRSPGGTLLSTILLHGIGLSPESVIYPGVITTVAGAQAWGYSGDGGPAANATLGAPQGLAIDPAGNIYIADSLNQVVRKISAGSGLISTVAGTGASGYSGDAGPAVNAKLNTPTGLCLDGAGNLYIADNNNNVVRVVMAATGNIYTVVGGGKIRTGSDGLGDGGPATSAILYGPTAVAVDPSGNIFISDSWHGLIRKVDASSGAISVLAGGGTGGGSDVFGDGGPAKNAILDDPQGIALDSSGNVYVADTGNHLVRLIAASTGIITAVAGNGAGGYAGDGMLATNAELNAPTAVRVDAAGDLYIADYGNSVVRRVASRSQIIYTLAGGVAGYSGDGGSPLQAQLNTPTDLVLDSTGNIYVADYSNNLIRKISPVAPLLSFSSTLVGEASPAQTVSTFNIGNQVATITSLTAPANFTQTTGGVIDCLTNTALAPGAGCSVAVGFVPNSAGILTGTLTINGSPLAPAVSTLSVSLSGLAQQGAAPALTLSTAALSFGNQLLNSSSAPQTITFSNTGGAPLAISAVWVTGGQVLDFSLTSNCQNVLAAGSSCTASITFSPQASGSRAASVSIVDSLASSPQTVQLSGTGVTAAPGLALSATALSFAAQTVSTTSAPQTITLSNTGTASLSMSSITVTGANAADFLKGTTCQSALAAGSSCMITITFSPQGTGSRSASLMIVDSLASSPQTIQLSGTGSATAPSGPALRQISGTLEQISVGSDGSAWGVNAAGQIYTFNAQTQNWQLSSGLQAQQVVVGPSGVVWALDGSDLIYRFNPKAQTWQTIPGYLSHLAVGSDGDAWGLNSAGFAYHFNTTTQGWDHVQGTYSQIAVGFDGAVWTLAGNGSIYRFNIASGSFEPIAGQLARIAVGCDGDVWGVNSANQIFHFRTLTQSWEQVPGTLAQISVGSATSVWGINAVGAVYHFDNASQNWTQVQGALAQISAAANGAVWGLDRAGDVYQYLQLVQQTGTLHSLPGTFARIATAADGDVWALDSTSEIWHFNRLLQQWERVPGFLTQIVAAPGGEVWGINSAGSIYRYTAATESWQNVPGLLAQIAMGANKDVWGINSAGAVYRFNRSSGNWSLAAGTQLSSISVGADGTVWGLSAGGQILEYNQQTTAWEGMPGVLTQIAVGSEQSVWGINGSGNIYRFDVQTQNWDQMPGNLARISIGFDGAVWAINGANLVYRFDVQAQTWQNVPGALSQLVAAADGAVFGLNAGGSPFRFQ